MTELIIEDGSQYYGYGFGADTDKVFELVFHTGVIGYQEIFSDPSYTYQGVVMTYPLIGNYGMAADDYETFHPTIGAMIVREYEDHPSNFRAEATLSEMMKKFDVPGISGIDTRKLTRSIRDFGSRKALITSVNTPLEKGLEILKETTIPGNMAEIVSCKESWEFLSNGPGDPAAVQPAIEMIQQLRGSVPMFGICLGHQLISLSYGAKTYKMKFGHHGGNHPVKNIATGKVEITSQNHSYAVDESSLKGTDLTITHMNLLDKTVEGVACEKDSIYSVQYHPESAPGPQDSGYLFDRFIQMMKEGKAHAKKN